MKSILRGLYSGNFNNDNKSYHVIDNLMLRKDGIASLSDGHVSQNERKTKKTNVVENVVEIIRLIFFQYL